MDIKDLSLQEQLRTLEHSKYLTNDKEELSRINSKITFIKKQLSDVRLGNWQRAQARKNYVDTYY